MMPAPAAAPAAASPSASASPAPNKRREKARRVLHSQIERRRREKINDRLISLRNTVPACCLMMTRLGHRMPLTGPLASRYAALPLAHAPRNAPDASTPDITERDPPLPRARHRASLLTNYDEELGLNKLDVLTHTVDYIAELHSHIDALTAMNDALLAQDASGAHPRPLGPRQSPGHGQGQSTSTSAPLSRTTSAPHLRCSPSHLDRTEPPGPAPGRMCRPAERPGSSGQTALPSPWSPTRRRPSRSSLPYPPRPSLPLPAPVPPTEGAAPRWSAPARDAHHRFPPHAHSANPHSRSESQIPSQAFSQAPAPPSGPVQTPGQSQAQSQSSLRQYSLTSSTSYTEPGLASRPTEHVPSTPALVAGTGTTTAGPYSALRPASCSGSAGSDGTSSQPGALTPPSADPLLRDHSRRTYHLPSPLSLPSAAAALPAPAFRLPTSSPSTFAGTDHPHAHPHTTGTGTSTPLLLHSKAPPMPPLPTLPSVLHPDRPDRPDRPGGPTGPESQHRITGPTRAAEDAQLLMQLRQSPRHIPPPSPSYPFPPPFARPLKHPHVHTYEQEYEHKHEHEQVYRPREWGKRPRLESRP